MDTDQPNLGSNQFRMHTKVVVNKGEQSEIRGIIRGMGLQFKQIEGEHDEVRTVYLVEISEGNRFGNGGDLVIAGKVRGTILTIPVTPEYITVED